jgi:hypothetical protein
MPSEGCPDSLGGGCPVAAMVIEVPQELKALGDAMVEALAAVTKARGGTAAGKALDYAAVEVAIRHPRRLPEKAASRAHPSVSLTSWPSKPGGSFAFKATAVAGRQLRKAGGAVVHVAAYLPRGASEFSAPSSKQSRASRRSCRGHRLQRRVRRWRQPTLEEALGWNHHLARRVRGRRTGWTPSGA